MLEAGSYYRLVVHTELGVDILPGVDTGDNPFVPLLEDLYAASLADIQDRPITYVQEAYFQTDAPPEALKPYVKWTSPEHQAVGIFRDNDLAVRFRRPHLDQMYTEDSAYPLRIEIRDTEGNLVPGYETVWSTAGSATLLPDERRWLEHVGQQPDDPSEPWPHDDVLEARRAAWLRDDFQDPSLRQWTRVDEGTRGAAASSWTVAGGELRQTVAIFGGPVASEALEKPGTYQLGGEADWQDVAISCTLRSLQDGAIGLMFRYRDKDNYYRFSMDRASRYRRLVKLQNGRAALLHQEDDGFELGRPYEVEVRAISRTGGGVEIQVTVDGRPWPLIVDDTSPIYRGRIGLYCWRNPGARFSAVRVLDPATPTLRPNARYTLQIRTGQQTVLHETTFTTSAFGRFRDLVRTYGGQPVAVDAAAPSAGRLAKSLATSAALAKALRDWEAGQVQFRDELLKGGRTRMEELRLALRTARAENDEAFRALCDEVFAGSAVNAYQPLAPALEVYALQAAAAPAAFWLRSPQGLDLRLAAPADDDPDGLAVHTSVGRTALELAMLQTGGAWQPQVLRLAHDADGTQLLLLPPQETSAWAGGRYRLTLTYHRNQGDEALGIDHRHDRPVERRLGSDASEVVAIEWQV